MSVETLPITPVAFAEAIKELSLPVLYAKVAELRNSVAHLQRSNQELRLFITESCESDAEKQELEGYIAENEGVKGSMNERIRLCKAEVEGRGNAWIELDPEANEATTTRREENQEREQDRPAAPGSTAGAAVNGASSTTNEPTEESGTEESRSRDGDGDEGVYL